MLIIESINVVPVNALQWLRKARRHALETYDSQDHNLACKSLNALTAAVSAGHGRYRPYVHRG
jgi:hypothetical protein